MIYYSTTKNKNKKVSIYKLLVKKNIHYVINNEKKVTNDPYFTFVLLTTPLRIH